MPEIQKFGENAVLVQWEQKIEHAIHREILNTEKYISEVFSEEVLETVPAYCSLAVYLKPQTSPEKFIIQWKSALKRGGSQPTTEVTHLFHIPVCYGGSFGPDLKIVSDSHQLSPEKVIALHCSSVYTVFFLGFLPGFPYLAGLPEELHTPRKDTPARQIVKGGVGIGGRQTGIYTIDSPGGWNIIGRSPLEFFNPEDKDPALFSPGDRIRFFSVTEAEYEKIAAEVSKGMYRLGKEVYHD